MDTINLDIFAWLAVIGGYGLGSIPFGLLLMRLGGHGDVRDGGSGNIGATNVLRAGHRYLALLTLILDALKGALAVQLGFELGGEVAGYLAAMGCFVGHLYPVWLRFKGGKGIATFLGLMLMLSPLTGILFMVSWLVLAGIFRISSLAALVSQLISLGMLTLLGEMQIFYLVLSMSILTFYAHRENIARLLKGTESRIGKANKK